MYVAGMLTLSTYKGIANDNEAIEMAAARDIRMMIVKRKFVVKWE